MTEGADGSPTVAAAVKTEETFSYAAPDDPLLKRRLFKKAHDRIGSRVAMHPGAVIAHAALAPLGGGRARMDHLRGVTYALVADGAFAPDGALAPGALRVFNTDIA
jgi:hypothetical protein